MITYCLGKHASVFQAETFFIMEFAKANNIRGLQGKEF